MLELVYAKFDYCRSYLLLEKELNIRVDAKKKKKKKKRNGKVIRPRSVWVYVRLKTHAMLDLLLMRNGVRADFKKKKKKKKKKAIP